MNPILPRLRSTSSPVRRAVRGLARLALLAPLALTAVTAPRPAAADGGFPLETAAVHQPSYGEQYTPDVAFGAGVSLSVWIDLRTGGLTGSGHDLYAQLIGTDGSIVFEGSLVLQRDFDLVVATPRVAWNGSVFLVTWPEAHSSGGGRQLKALRLAPDGTVLDAEPIIIYDGPSSGMSHDVESDGESFLVAYAIPNAGVARVDAVRVAGDGTVIDATPLAVRPAGGSPSALLLPRIAFGSGLYMVTWMEEDFTRAARVTTNGNVLDPGGVQLTPFASWYPDIASDGDRFMVAWTEFDALPSSNAGGGILDPDTMSIAAFRNLTTVADDGPAGPGSIAFGGGNYLVMIYRPEPAHALLRDIYGILTEPDGGAPVGGLFPIEIQPITDDGNGAVAFDGTNFLAVYEDDREGSGGYGIYGKRLTTSGGMIDVLAFLVSPSASWQLASAAAFGDDGYLVVWEDWREGPATGYKSDLYATRVAPDGTVLDDPARLVAHNIQNEQQPQIARGDGQYLIVYEYGGLSTKSVRGARVLFDGTVLDVNGFLIAQPLAGGTLSRPQVAFNGEKYLVVWHNSYGPASSVGVVGVLVGQDGVIESPAPIGIGTLSFAGDTGFDVASDGAGFLVTWYTAGPSVMRATRVSASGQILGTSILTTSSFSIGNSRVAHNGDSYLVAWKLGLTTIQAVRVGANGLPIGVPMNVESTPRGFGDVVAHGDTFVIPFFLEGSGDAGSPDGEYFTQIGPDGEMLLERQLLEAVSIDEVYASGSIASAGAGADLLFASSLWADMPFNAPRVEAQMIQLGGGGPAADLDGDGVVGFGDLLILLGAWGPCGAPCPADLDGSGAVGFGDLLVLLGSWG